LVDSASVVDEEDVDEPMNGGRGKTPPAGRTDVELGDSLLAEYEPAVPPHDVETQEAEVAAGTRAAVSSQPERELREVANKVCLCPKHYMLMLTPSSFYHRSAEPCLYFRLRTEVENGSTLEPATTTTTALARTRVASWTRSSTPSTTTMPTGSKSVVRGQLHPPLPPLLLCRARQRLLHRRRARVQPDKKGRLRLVLCAIALVHIPKTFPIPSYLSSS
jgi:hypothetical protein